VELPQAQYSSLGPYFQGLLMQHVNQSYANELHASSFKPYSQHCFYNKEKNCLQWTICSLSSIAHSEIIEPLSGIQTIRLSRPGISFDKLSQVSEVVSLKQLTSQIHRTEKLDFTVRFTTPTAFKSQGEYVFMPTIRLIFQNLLMHFNKVAEGIDEADQDTLDYIVQHTRITSYRLNSSYFAHINASNTKIPAFVGTIKLHVDNVGVLPGFVEMLLSFGEFSGIGIKTAMGMGGIDLINH
jgi:CRISPR-associated endoribonuclease Cas6